MKTFASYEAAARYYLCDVHTLNGMASDEVEAFVNECINQVKFEHQSGMLRFKISK